jgi:hypothetical protein
MPDTTTCAECGAEILSRTAAKTGGKCMPCAQGTRADIEAGKRHAAEERERRRVNEAVLQRIRAKEHPIFADFLVEDDPIGVLWPFLVSIVFRDSETEDVANLTPPARNLYLVVVFDAEVVNGGLHQYFSNSSGAFAYEALAALREVGAAEAADLLRTAINAFPQQIVPGDRRERNQALDAVEPPFLDALDTKYYSFSDTGVEDLGNLMLAFMRRHASDGVAA